MFQKHFLPFVSMNECVPEQFSRRPTLKLLPSTVLLHVFCFSSKQHNMNMFQKRFLREESAGTLAVLDVCVLHISAVLFCFVLPADGCKRRHEHTFPLLLLTQFFSFFREKNEEKKRQM